MRLVSLIFLITALTFNSQAQEKRKSPAKTVENTIDGNKITIAYSSPSVKGRKVYGGLEPYGKVWRAGANEATTFEITEDIEIDGNTLKAGKYAFFVIPDAEDEWTLIFNKTHKQWGAYDYKEEQDALRVEAKPETIGHTEQLTYSISDEGMVYLDWATTRVGFKID